MYIASHEDYEYDPLCPSKLFIMDADTFNPRPELYQVIIQGSLDNGGMKCEPCIEPGFPDGQRCICGCFQFDQPQLFTGTGGISGDAMYPNSCDDLTTRTAPRTITMTPPGGQCMEEFPFVVTCQWQFYDGDYGAVGGGDDYSVFTIESDSVPHANGNATLSIFYQRIKHSGFGGALWLVGGVYDSTDFSPAGGTFVLRPGFTSMTITGGCTGGTPTWNIPTTISVTRANCP